MEEEEDKDDGDEDDEEDEEDEEDEGRDEDEEDDNDDEEEDDDDDDDEEKEDGVVKDDVALCSCSVQICSNTIRPSLFVCVRVLRKPARPRIGIRWCFSGTCSEAALCRKLSDRGGLVCNFTECEVWCFSENPMSL